MPLEYWPARIGELRRADGALRRGAPEHLILDDYVDLEEVLES